jgi:hypothetical protein
METAMRNDDFEEMLDRIGALGGDDPVHAHQTISGALSQMGDLTPSQQKILRERCEEVLDDYWDLPLDALDRLLNVDVD